jgi:hypothetical protein
MLVLGLFKEHFFIDENVNISTFWVKNFIENKANKEFL